MSEATMKYTLKVKVNRFEGKFAILETGDGHELSWPIKELPDDVQEGTQVRLMVSTAKTSAEAQQKLARAMINTLLSNEYG